MRSQAITDQADLSRWQVYIARCADSTLYTGVTTDTVRREAEHNGKSGKGARYTAVRRPVEIIWVEAAQDRAAACRREAQIKKLSRAQKLSLIAAASAD